MSSSRAARRPDDGEHSAPRAARPAAGTGPGARELAIAWLVALVAFAVMLRDGLFDPGRVQCAVDTATSQLPWSAAPGGSTAVANPELADQGMVFYPAYRFVLREWGSDGPPLWNPLIYAGAPAIGNPQLGLLDPQVLAQVALGRLFGEQAFDWSFALLLWLRLAAGAVGAFALGRRLSLGPRGASLAAIGFSTAGFVVSWANHSLGHVAPFLPWVLYHLEGLRASESGRRAGAFVLATLLFCAAILGGHPETAFNTGVAGGVFALGSFARDRRAALLGLGALALGTSLAAPSLIPFAEYLANSGALVARRLAEAALPGGAAGEPDWIALGLFALCAGVVWRARELERARGSFPLPVHALLGAALGALVALAFARVDLPSSRLVLWPEAFGTPHDPEGYRGGGVFLEQASAWLAPAVLVLALAAALSPAPAPDSGLRRRRTLLALGLASLLIALRAPGAIDVFRWIPVIGLSAGVRFALVSALCLSLLAGEALERAPRTARVAALGALAVLAPLALRHAPEIVIQPSAEFARVDPDDGVVDFDARPAPILDGAVALSGTIAPGLDVRSAEVVIEGLGGGGTRVETVPVTLTRRAGASGPLAFAAPRLWLEHLDEGLVRFTLRLSGEGGRELGRRVAAVSVLAREPALHLPSLVYWLLAALFVLALPAWGPATALLWFAALQGLASLAGVHPALPRERVFPPTATEAILARELGTRRYFAEPGVLPANTGMVRGLRALDGYDGLDPASFDGYRAAALRPGVQPLIGFEARNAELGGAPFRLLGVGALVLAAPLDPDLGTPGIELVASPEPGAPERAECWIYRVRDPLPRVFCVPRIVTREAALADLAGFDPLAAAFLEDGATLEFARPFSRADVRGLAFTNDAVSFEVELDGDGLAVITEQHFPGWRVTVDGEERPLLRADSIFRAVALGPGKHQVELRYAPASWRAGLWLAAAAFAALLATFLRLRRESATP